MEYSSAVRQRFESPSANVAGGEPEIAVAGSGGDRSLNAWVRFTVGWRNGTLTEVGFNVFGCPHLIAACDWAAEWLRGRPVSTLRELPTGEMVDALGVPREKVGKLLRLEDALIACAEQVERSRETKGGE